MGASSIPSGSYKAALRYDVMYTLLEVFSGIFVAEQAQKGLSLLKGKVGQAVAAPCVTLIDDPLLPGGFASTPFDAEGVATRTKSVIENGVLTTLLYNLKTAGQGRRGHHRQRRQRRIRRPGQDRAPSTSTSSPASSARGALRQDGPGRADHGFGGHPRRGQTRPPVISPCRPRASGSRMERSPGPWSRSPWLATSTTCSRALPTWAAT